jgi:polyribonucleotide nucleotidyltransferase
MLDIKEKKITIDGKEITVRLGEYAHQANGSVVIQCGDTVVHGVVAMGDENPNLDFFPMTIEYHEGLYAGGRIKGSRFIKREGRPSDESILRARLIDRSVRPMFPKGFKRDVQLVINILATDHKTPHDTLGLYAAILALAVSDIPFDSHMGGIRLAQVNGQFVVNPSYEECDEMDFELVLAGNEEKIVMIECAADCTDDEQVIKGFEASYEPLGKLAEFSDQLRKEFGKEKVHFEPQGPNQAIIDKIKDTAKSSIAEYFDKMKAKTISKKDFKPVVVEPVLALFSEEEIDEYGKKNILEELDTIFKKTIRENILTKKLRLDGRGIEEVREIEIKTGVLPRVHGSGMFMRGGTQVLNILTLGAPGSEQLLESIEGEVKKHYIHHYSAPPYSVGETGRFGTPGRREIGHGGLAEKALWPVIPSKEEFPYVMRLVSEVMGQNGSSSMGSTCASTLSLMDGGVPIKAPVAGISIGLMTGDSTDDFITITDIQGVEDFSGDMDFKVAGTKDSITAIQMDTKIHGITQAIVAQSIRQAKAARLHILDKITAVIPEPNRNISEFAMKITSTSIPTEFIGKVVGPSGKVIRALSEQYEVEINIEDDGSVFISGINQELIDKCKTVIQGIVTDPEVGAVYKGVVARIMDFGAIVELFPGKDGLVHISNISSERVEDINAVLEVGQEVEVRLYEIDGQGRLNLTMNLDQDPASIKRPRKQMNTRNRHNDRNDRNKRRH